MMERPETGQALRRWRQALGLSQSEAAQVLAMPCYMIYRWERYDTVLPGPVQLLCYLCQMPMVLDDIKRVVRFQRKPRGRPRKVCVAV